MITLADYWMGREESYASALTMNIFMRARETVHRANEMLDALRETGLEVPTNPHTGTVVTSGWRPPQVNAATFGAAAHSRHMTGEAIDLYDPDGLLDEWAMDNQDKLAAIGIWLEHPSATKGWCHVQTVPPRSGRRVFYP